MKIHLYRRDRKKNQGLDPGTSYTDCLGSGFLAFLTLRFSKSRSLTFVFKVSSIPDIGLELMTPRSMLY